MTFICLTHTPAGLCCNCGDEGILLRGETPVVNGKGLTFCTVECADEFDTRQEREELERATRNCVTCGYDNHEHAPGCVSKSAAKARTKGCTGLTARWCPIHGDCLCPRIADGDSPAMDDPLCPLHRPLGEHPMVKRTTIIGRKP